MIVAGEASGDHHAGRLIEELQRIDPGVHCVGIGGDHMRRAGAEILVDASEMAVMGLLRVLANLPFFFSVANRLLREIQERRIELLILVDYPDFNLRLAKKAKRLGIKVLFYVSPQVWAWRRWRVFEIKKRVDHMAVLFPFEVPFYEQAGVPVTFVGHPLRGEVHSDLSPAEARQAFGLDPERPVLGLLPGSRRSEIEHMLPTMLEGAALVRQVLPEVQFILPRAATLSPEFLAPFLAAAKVEVTVATGRPYDVMRGCDAIVCASGTATLETALMQVPLVVIYRTTALAMAVFKRLIKVEHIGLCNIVAGQRMATELIQDQASPENIAREALRLLQDREAAEAMRHIEAGLCDKLGEGDAAQNVAKLAMAMLEKR
ncbi:MAG: lipid-A-disaccharide synthase [Alphaproteobacteria bacterium CG_4_10_14_0_2_um_filter_63_37]|nr:MAG: lipid-A-disaccharide synthase [Proteobacteria bacterium CG1_02_64_396]PJA23504.1 MAG: lipid-A-disaccharide synthase [Alphaproteobacteria bacterium CG_4_10_14_0_2_um_filter_63_37]